MCPFWHLILFIFVFNSVLGNSTETHNKTQQNSKKLDTVTPDKAKQSNEDKENSADVKRPLQAGDTFVPMEFLPITRRLFAKRKPGEGGRGIVSGSKTPEEMAERIYRAYFLTERRIVILSDKDLRGLDLLTALAMDGEVVKTRSSGDSVTEKPTHLLNLNGQFVGVDPGPLRCHYKLLYKTIKPPDSESVLRKRHDERSTPFNKILKMEKKMRPNRSLIVNHKGRRSNKDKSSGQEKSKEAKKKVSRNKKSKNRRRSQKKISKSDSTGNPKYSGNQSQEKKPKAKQNRRKNHQSKHRKNKRRHNLTRNKKSKNRRRSLNKISKSNSTENLKNLKNQSFGNDFEKVPLTTTQRPSCRWRFFCQDPRDVDTCRLHTSCFDGANNNAMLDKGVVDTIEKDHHEKEKTELVMHFRKMLQITSLDEDVEKIIEQHVLLVKPENMAPDDKVETLDQYFNNIIMAEYARYTTPSPNKDADKPHHVSLEADSEENESQEQNPPLMGLESKEKIVKEPSASTDIEENQAFKSPAEADKFGSLDATTVAMKASRSK